MGRPNDEQQQEIDPIVERAREMRERVADQAEDIAKTEDEVAATLSELAKSRPGRADHLRHEAQRAVDAAAKERRRAARYRGEGKAEAEQAP